MSHKELLFEKVVGTQTQIETLYTLLSQRKHNISHSSSPTLLEHSEFVKNHPYRIWYLISMHQNYIGSAYILKNNCIGVSLVSKHDLFNDVIKFMLTKHKPLKEIKSVRPPYFYVNIAPDNTEIERYLLALGACKIQLTFSLPSMTM